MNRQGSIVELGQTRYNTQVARLERLGIPELFDVQGDFNSWLAQFRITPFSLGSAGSFIVLPSGLIPTGDRRDYWRSLCSDLKFHESMAGKMTTHMDRSNQLLTPYVIEDVSFDLQSEVAEQAVKDWTGLQNKLQTANRVGLTAGELIMMITYSPHRFDWLLGLGSVGDGQVPCLEPAHGEWQLSLKSLNGLLDSQTNNWVYPLGGASRVVAPTAKLLALSEP